MKNLRYLAVLLAVFTVTTASTFAHCEIPCGIYDDSTRIVLMREHVTTIEKSMKQITALSAKDSVDYNQLVRWVMNKEKHAEALQEVVTQYFMFQRVKPVDQGDPAHFQSYVNQLALLHTITVYAMKAKQTTDLKYIEQLRTAITEFEAAYFAK